MSRYDWPQQRRPEERDDAVGRGDFMRLRRRELDLSAALTAARTTSRPAGVAFAPPNSRDNLWIPLGPSTVVQGQAEGAPRVSGRVRSLWVHPDGVRVYAATANGGVWYSPDGGESWQSLGGLAPTGMPGIVRPAHRHVCGAILVVPDKAAPDDPDEETVYVGTGELIPNENASPGSKLGGIGVLVAKGPTTSSAADPWTEEAPNLLEKAVFRLAVEPGGTTVVAATTIGLLQRPAGAGQGIEWPRIAGAPFADMNAVVTDVLWTAAVGGGAPSRLWVWARGDQSGLWVRNDGEVDFKPIATADATSLRGALAAADPPSKVYVFNNRGDTSRPALYQVTSAAGLPTAARVFGIPNVVGTQGNYDLAVAVDPNNDDLVVLGGSYTDGPPDVPRVRRQNANVTGQDYDQDAAIFAAEVGMKAAVLTYGHTTDPVRIGVGCHADVHDLRYADTGAQLWAGCDGGVFRSTFPDQNSGFVARNNGLGVIQANYVASHPTCEGRVVVGLQDNGIIERSSSAVWLHTGDGDGGGVAFDLTDTTRYVRQYFDGQWTASDGGPFNRLLAYRPVGAPFARHADAIKERDNSAFYSQVATIAHHRGGAAAPTHTQVLIGTTRAWYTEDWAGDWVTLPRATDPITTTTFDKDQDDFGEPITVCKWATSDVAWILGERKLMRLVREKDSDVANPPGSWDDDVVLNLNRKASKSSTEGPDALRKVVVWTDVEPNLDAPGAQHGPKGAAYLGTVGKPDDDDVDTLWWFDGDETWHPTGLRDEVAAPVTAIRCDPKNPNDVWVGTTIGVWHGERDIDTLTWDWMPLLNGLPEAAVEDLALFDSGDGLRLLRAAIAARGVWELRLGSPVEDVTYVRAHDDDLRYRLVAHTKQRDGTTERSWHGSPDIRPRVTPVDLPGLPGVVLRQSAPGSDVRLRRFQAALRSQSGDDRVRSTGAWDLYFEDVLRDLGAPIDAGSGRPTIDEAFWNSVMVAPHATREPWATAGQPDRLPTEADLLDLTPPLAEGDLGSVSLALTAVAHKVDVVVHHRGLIRLGSDVRVTLLRWTRRPEDPIPRRDDPSTWFTGPITWAAAVDEVLNSSSGTTSHSPGGGWLFVGSNAASRRKTLTGQDIDSAQSAVATFDLDLSPFRNGTVMLLAAVIRAGGESALATLPLRGLVLSDPHVAVRSLVVER